MAKIEQPLSSASVSGTVGGLVFQRSKTGCNGYAWRPPTKSRSVSSRFYLTSTFQQINFAWSNLDSTSRQTWNDFSLSAPPVFKLGQTYKLTGRDWWFKLNTVTLKYFNLINSLAPNPSAALFFPVLGAQWTGAGASLSFVPAIPADSKIVVFSAIFNKSLPFANRKGKFTKTLSSSDSSPALISGAAGVVSPYPGISTILADSWNQWRVFAVNQNGFSTVPLFFNLFCTS